MLRFFFVQAVTAVSLFAWDKPPSPSYTPQEFNGYLQEAMTERNWWAVVDYADILSAYFPTSPFAEEASFLRGKAYLQLQELEEANECFTAYLNEGIAPKHFEEAIQYKFSIAEQFRSGVKKALFRSHKCPKWLSAKEDALKIYEEVIAALPHHEMAAESLLAKAKIQAEFEEYKPGLETLDLLIRRFPKHELAAEGYLEKMKIYLAESAQQSPDPDLLGLAEVNLRKFRLAFPREGRLADAEKVLSEMQSLFAQNLFDMGRFFEKTKKIPASLLYYANVVSRYPDTEVAKLAREKLEQLQPSSSKAG